MERPVRGLAQLQAGCRIMGPRCGQVYTGDEVFLPFFLKFFQGQALGPSSSNRKWLLKSKAEAPSTLRDPLPAEIQFHEFFETDLSVVTRNTIF